jgi:CheY-like chemotaxis protein
MNEKPKILVVDDDADLVETIRLVLESKNYRVVSALNAKEGLDKVKSERPDLILLDIMMPQGTEGFHLVWNLRQEQEKYFQEVPIIVMTAIHQKTDLRFYPEAGDASYKAGEYLPVQDFLDKPVQPDRLLERVEHALKTWGQD